MREALLSAVAVAFLLSGCSGGKEDNDSKNQQIGKALSVQADSVTGAGNLAKESKKAAEKFTEEMKNIAKESGNEIVKDITSKISDGIKGFQALVPKKSQNNSSEALNNGGKDIFKVCAGCHGQRGDQKALGVSKIIAGWSAPKVEEILKKYKNENFSDPMKNIMKGQATQLSDEDIKKVAKYISTL